MAGLLIAMFVINSRNQQAYLAKQKREKDSIAALQPKIDTSLVVKDSLRKDSMVAQKASGIFQPDSIQDQSVVLENNVMKVVFSTKGAQVQSVTLKKFNCFDGQPVVLQQNTFNQFSYTVNAGSNQTAEIANIHFVASPITRLADNGQSIDFVAGDSMGRKIIHQFVLRPDDYMLDLNITLDGADQLLSQNRINFVWQQAVNPIEKDKTYELGQTHLCFEEDNRFDFEYVGRGDSKSFGKPVNWIGVKQQFFASVLVAKNALTHVNTTWTVPADTTKESLASYITTGQASIPAGKQALVPLQLYFGPSDYNVLKQYNNHLEYMVPYGSGIFAFVKYINRYFLLPVFDYLQHHIASMGMVILLLTLLIRLITSPILYKSYLSGAKMKVLKPEVDALKEKYKDDQQAFGMEQMKLWRSAGVSPLGGCLPALLQIPIFMSLYYFFQSNIDLRGKHFLWAHDLAAYDSIAKLPFAIPFYGDHVSLFTLTAVLTSLLISLYSMNNMQDNSNPLMKYMPYIFPVLLLGVFNKLPAALTWYYTVSNTITLLLQIVIQKYIIDHDKIMLQIAENRKKPVKKSKMQERIEAMQESQRKLEELKKKSDRK